MLDSQVGDSVADIDSNALWVVEGLNVHYGGADCTESQDIRIKHMMTNTYLTFGSDGGLASLDAYADDMAGAIDGFECRYAAVSVTASLPHCLSHHFTALSLAPSLAPSLTPLSQVHHRTEL